IKPSLILGDLRFRHREEVRSVALSPDGKHLATAGMGLTVWEVTTGRKVYEREDQCDFCVTYSADGKQLAGARFEEAKIWDPATGRERHSLKGHKAWIRSMAFSPDGKRLASGCDKMVKVWDTTNGKELVTINGDT